MNKNIYATSDEKFVKATVLFSSEDKIYYDEACTEEVTLEDALNLFKKGLMLVSVDGGFKRPTGITVTEEGYEISYGGNGGGSGESEQYKIIISEEDDQYTADKSYAEIMAAIEAGKNVFCQAYEQLFFLADYEDELEFCSIKGDGSNRIRLYSIVITSSDSVTASQSIAEKNESSD